MSLPVKPNVIHSSSLPPAQVSVQSAPAVLENTSGIVQSLPTPDSLPKKLRERFYYTPGLSSFLNRILHLSVISGTSPEDTANEFFRKYSEAIESGVKYPALKAYSSMTTVSFSS